MSGDQSESHLPSTKYFALLAAAPQIGEVCLNVNRAYAECKMNGDPSPKTCANQGEKVTACVIKVLRHAEDNCMESFKAYQTCLHSEQRRLQQCRTEQAAFEKCFGEL